MSEAVISFGCGLATSCSNLFYNQLTHVPKRLEQLRINRSPCIILGMPITIAVGSINPVKLAAAKAVLSQAFPDASFLSLAVPSGVPDQPWGDEQTRLGAYNRAENAVAAAGADFGLGLEGGLVETSVGLMTCAWCAMVDSRGKVGYGGGVRMLLPPIVVKHLRQHGELGPAMDDLVNEEDTKRGRGAVGILTNGLSSRQTAYEQLVAMAAGPFVTGYYGTE